MNIKISQWITLTWICNLCIKSNHSDIGALTQIPESNDWYSVQWAEILILILIYIDTKWAEIFRFHLSLSFPRGIFFSSSIQSQDAPTNTFCWTLSQICRIFHLIFMKSNLHNRPNTISSYWIVKRKKKQCYEK